MASSPYEGISREDWAARTRELINQHPMKEEEIVQVVLKVWEDIFQSGIGSNSFKIGKDLFPKPQIMGFFLHELIPLELSHRYPDLWRPELFRPLIQLESRLKIG